MRAKSDHYLLQYAAQLAEQLYNNQIPVTTISRALGHNNESTTRIYLATLDNTAVELANKKVLESLS
jgi:integrase